MMIPRHVLLVLMLWSSVALFFSGFLLSKREITTRSNVTMGLDEDVSGDGGAISNDGEHWKGCNTLHDESDGGEKRGRKIARVVFLIVDALRLDFMTYHPPPNTSHSPHLSTSFNNFHHMHHLLRHNSSKCALFGFRADPPTTTSQRLKGLMTGGLPAFVEFGANFNSAAVGEDSLIHQWHQSGKKMIMMGDDTWLNLFPYSFYEAHPFDSFNTRDLNTVDDGIMKKFLPLLQKDSKSLHSTSPSKWDIVISHFLGVDHIGHTYHAHHPLMAERLKRMDTVLIDVVNELQQQADDATVEDGDSLLVVFGDHGMTDQGEHGGNSMEESLSGLFVYSTGDLFFPDRNYVVDGQSSYYGDHILTENIEKTYTPRWNNKDGKFVDVDVELDMIAPRIVNQVDLVPTLALLLHGAVPYTSLGHVIPELFASDTSAQIAMIGFEPLLDALYANSVQVMRYLFRYFLHLDSASLGNEHNVMSVNESLFWSRVRQCEEEEVPDECKRLAVEEQSHVSVNSSRVEQTMLRNGSVLLQGSVQGEVWRLYRMYLDARVCHLFFIKILKSNEMKDDMLGEEKMVVNNLRTNALKLYSSFLTESLSFCRIQWSNFNVSLMICGIVVCILCLMLLASYLTFPEVPTSWTHFSRRVGWFILSKSLCGGHTSGGISMSSFFSCAFVVFLALSAFSNSFIISEEAVYFFGFQMISLLRIFEFIALKVITSITFHLDNKSVESIRKGLWQSGSIFCIDLMVLIVTRWLVGVSKELPTANGDTIGGVFGRVVTPVLVLMCLCWYISFNLSPPSGMHPTSSHRGVVVWMQQRNIVSSFLYTISSIALALYFLTLSTLSDDGGGSHASSLVSALHYLNLHAKLILDCSPCLVLCNGAAGLCLSWAQLLRARNLRLRLLSAFHLYFHLANVVLLVTVHTQNVVYVMGHALVVASLLSLTLFSKGCESLDWGDHYQLSGGDNESAGGIKNNHTSVHFSFSWLVVQITLQVFALGRLLYFLSGHGYDFGTLQLSAGLIGVDFFHFWYAGCLVVVNTLGYELLGIVSLLILLQLHAFHSNDKTLYNSTRPAHLVLWSACLVRVLLLLGSMCSALLLRRHLMLWAIFAPKVIFEAIFSSVGVFCLCFIFIGV